MASAKKRKAAVLAAAILVVAILLIGWWALHNKQQLTPEQQVTQRLQEGVQACNQGQISKCEDFISQDYGDSSGFNKRLIEVRLNRLRSQPWRWRIDVGNLIFLPGIEAGTIEVDTHVQLSEKGSDGFYQSCWSGPVAVVFKQEGHTWRVIKSSGWQQDLVIR